jgi:hypothetical protein
MDEINYRRLVNRSKIRCEDCGATSYEDPKGVFRCVVCDHDRFEVCLDCGHLEGWCECPPPPEPEPKKRARRTKAKAPAKAAKAK